MANLSTYSANALVAWLDGNASMPTVTTRYLALYNGSPTVSGTGGTEVTATVCAGRIAMTSAMATSSGGAGSSTSSSDITWSTSATGSATVNYIAAFDAATSGNMIWFASVTSNTIYSGNLVKIAAGNLTVTSGTNLSGYSMDYLVNWMTGVSSFPATGTRYYSLWNGNPTSGGTEVTSTIRAAGRLAFTSTMGSASSGSATNSSSINFGNAAGGATMSYTAAYDASSGGNLLIYSAITGGAQTVTAGNPVLVPASSQTISAA